MVASIASAVVFPLVFDPAEQLGDLAVEGIEALGQAQGLARLFVVPLAEEQAAVQLVGAGVVEVLGERDLQAFGWPARGCRARRRGWRGRRSGRRRSRCGG